MKDPRRRGSAQQSLSPLGSRTTADATPNLSAGLQNIAAGTALDELVGRVVFRFDHPAQAHGVSTSWQGAKLIVDHLTTQGCYCQIQIHANQCICQVLHVLDGAALAKQLAVATARTFPEAAAKAALLACLQMAPQTD